MTANCEWVEQNLEALFSERLSAEEDRAARSHIENCASCGMEVQRLNAIDPVIRRHFHRQLAVARQPRVLRKGRILGLSTATAAVFALVITLLLRAPEPSPFAPSVTTPDMSISPVALEESPPGPIKEDETGPVIRTKPEAAAAVPDAKTQPAAPPAADAPEFLVIDPAGYTHTLDEYRGRTVVMGVWSSEDDESSAAIEDLYKNYAVNTHLRFIGVANQRHPRPANTSFPIVYNQGSKLFGARSGDFVVVSETGAVELRGLLTADLDALRRLLDRK